MSTNKKEGKAEETLHELESALSTAEHFIERNQKILSYALLGLVIVVSGYWLTKKYYYLPQEEKAEVAIFRAQLYFEKDSFKLALNGSAESLGLVEIARKYSSTKAGNLANYYAGISYLNIGNYQKAIDYLEDFSTDDNLVEAISIGAIGDAYLELGNKDKAANYYTKAAKNDNEFTAPTYLFKLGLLQEEMNKNKEALESYQTIKNKYKKSAEYTFIDKYITRVSLLSK